jgi:hypothetical protein
MDLPAFDERGVPRTLGQPSNRRYMRCGFRRRQIDMRAPFKFESRWIPRILMTGTGPS